MNIPPVHVVTIAEALPPFIAEVREILVELADLCRQEEGCIRFDVYADASRPNFLNTIELWQTQTLHTQHLNSKHVATAVMALIGKMRGIPEVRVLTAISELPE